MNLPNRLTILRIILTFVFIFLLFSHGFLAKILALVAFTIACVTDFYDGYIVNAIIDACYKSSKSKKWEEVELEIWRGSGDIKKDRKMADFDDKYYLIKEEIMPNGSKKLILKDKVSGEIIQREK